jgi:hypothetical protein
MENKFSNKFMIYILIITQIITNEAIATGPPSPPPLKDEPPVNAGVNRNSSFLELDATTDSYLSTILDTSNITNNDSVSSTAGPTTEVIDEMMLVPPAEVESEILQKNSTENPNIPKFIFK